MNNDDEAEAFLLGAVLNQKFARHQVLTELEMEDFYNHRHRNIYQGFASLYRDGLEINPISTARSLKDLKILEDSGGLEYLTYLADNFCSVDVDYYIGILKNLSAKRELALLGLEMQSKANNPETVGKDLVAKYSQVITSIGTYSRDKFVDMKEIGQNYKDGKSYINVLLDDCHKVDSGEDLFDGVRTYYPKLDNLVGGFYRGTNTIIGARSSTGKTTFLANLFLNIHENAPHIRIGFFSLEMSKSRIYEKLICTIAGVNFRELAARRVMPADFLKIQAADKKLQGMNMTIFDRSGININDFRSHIRREVANNGLDIVFLDYLTIVQAYNKSGNKHQEIDQISKGIQSIGLELNIPMVTLSQLNRAVYGRTDKTPILSDLRESGSIEEDSDLILFLHRPTHYMSEKERAHAHDTTQIIVAKSRLIGDLGKLQYGFNSGRYVELEPIEKLLPGDVVHKENEPFKPSSMY